MTCDVDPVNALVADMLEIRRYRATVPGAKSPMGRLLDELKLGVNGTGCSSGYPQMNVPEMRAMDPEPEAVARCKALKHLPGTAVRAWLLETELSEDARPHPLRLSGSGERIAAGDRRAAAREQPVTLAQACAWALVDDATRAKWARAIVRGDARPALSAMTVRGEALLATAAKEWVR